MAAADADKLLGRVRDRIAAGRHLDRDECGFDEEPAALDPLPPPATQAAVAEVEHLLGAALPVTLRRLLLEVANGGFGPGYGLLGLRDGHAVSGSTATDALGDFRDGPGALLPICDWGCGILSVVHCPTGHMYGWDPNPVGPDEDVPLFPQEHTFETWLSAWLDGELFQPWLVIDPATGAYRGATAAESRQAMLEQ